MIIQGQDHKIQFHRKPVPVTFFQRGRQVTQNRMSTTAVLMASDGSIRGSATVRPYHRDQYDRKRANEAAVHKLADQFAHVIKIQILKGFFNKPE